MQNTFFHIFKSIYKKIDGIATAIPSMRGRVRLLVT